MPFLLFPGEQEDRQTCDNISPVLRKASYFSSPRSSSAAAAAFAAYSAALTAASVASQDSPLAPSTKTRFQRRHQQQNASVARGIGEPEANVVPRSKSFVFRRHSSARSSTSTSSTNSLNKRVRGYFSRFRGFGRVSSSKSAAYSAWYKKGVGSNSGTESMEIDEEGSLREETSSWSNSDFGGQNPFWQRATAQPRNKKHNNSHGSASRPAEAGGGEDGAAGVSAKLGDPRWKKSIWRRIFGLDDKNLEKKAGETNASVAWDAPQQYNVSNRSSDDETSETSSSSDIKQVAVAPKRPVMMRGNVHPIVHSNTGSARQSSLRQATPPRRTAFADADNVSASGRKLTEAHLRDLETLSVSPNRKVRFKIPTSPLDPYYSPSASVSIGPVEMSDAIEQSDRGTIDSELERRWAVVNIGAEEPSQDEAASKKIQKLLASDRYWRSDGSPNVQWKAVDIDGEDDEDDGDIRSLFTERGGRKYVEEAGVPSTAMTRSVVRMKKSTLEVVPSRRSILPRYRDGGSGVTGRPRHNSRIEAIPSSHAVVPPVPTPQALSSPGAGFGRDTLGKIHGLLASTLALIEPGASQQRSCERAAEAVAKLTAAHTVYPSPPSAWVARYVDKSAKFGLGFFLSDGTVGVRFNDASKIALEATGKAFEYVERPRRKPRARVTTGIGLAPETGDLMDHWHAPRSRHSLHDYSPGLEKKVKLLKYFRKDLRMLGGENADDDDLDDEKDSPATLASLAGEIRDGSAEQAAVVPLTVVEKWRRTRHSCLFFLSTLTVQARRRENEE